MTGVPQRGNRSTGKVGDYLHCISRGYTVDEVGAKFGVSGGAVRKALARQNLPTCALDYLRWLHKKDSSAADFRMSALPEEQE